MAAYYELPIENCDLQSNVCLYPDVQQKTVIQSETVTLNESTNTPILSFIFLCWFSSVSCQNNFVFSFSREALLSWYSQLHHCLILITSLSESYFLTSNIKWCWLRLISMTLFFWITLKHWNDVFLLEELSENMS